MTVITMGNPARTDGFYVCPYCKQAQPTCRKLVEHSLEELRRNTNVHSIAVTLVGRSSTDGREAY